MATPQGTHRVLRAFAWAAAVLGGIEALAGVGYALQRTGQAAMDQAGPSLLSTAIHLAVGLGFLAWGIWILRITRTPKGTPAPRRPDEPSVT
jgi:hypothetical protein